MGDDAAYAEASASFGSGNHGEIDRGFIQILDTASGIDYLRNIGAHEFGHILGLADVDVTDPRTEVMDNVLNGKYIAPTPGNSYIYEHYTVTIPEPTTLILIGLGGVLLRKR